MLENQQASRDAYFDNLRFILIFLVVAGHILLPLDKTRLAAPVIFFIYTFHMPCFVFVSGYFSKHVCDKGRFRTDKLFQILWMYLIFKVLVHITEGLVEGHIGLYIDFFTESGAPWYLLSLAFWYLTLPVVKELKPATVMAGSLIISLLSGYEFSVKSFLAMDRTLAFAPFFYAGYYMSQETKEKFLNSGFRYAVLAAAALTSVVLYLFNMDRLMPFTHIVYGVHYPRLGEALYPYGALIRIVWYLLATLLSLGLMAAVGRKRSLFTAIGSRTLQIYVLHRLVRDLMQYFGVYQRVDANSAVWIGGLLVFAFVLTVILGNQMIERMFRVVQWKKKA